MPPLLLLGLDAGDPDLLLEGARTGALPVLASVMRRGLWGRTAGAEMVSEHGLWTTLFSGVSRAEHGHYYHRQLKPGTYDLVPVDGPDVGAPPFWSHLDGRRAVILDPPHTGFVDGLPGIQLLDWGVHHPVRPARARPVEVLGEAGPRLVLDEVLEASLEQDLLLFDGFLRSVERKGRLGRSLLAPGGWDLAVAVFGESHTGGHQFWRYRRGEHRLARALEDLYRAIDTEIGRLLEVLQGPLHVAVVSSVGLKPMYPVEGLVPAFLRALGYQAVPRGGGRGGWRRLVPQGLRNGLSTLLPRRVQDRLLAEKYRAGIDWTRTEAFAIPSYYAGYLRVNLEGREPGGIVPPSRYHEVLDRLAADLEALVDPRTGRPAVREVARTTELFGGGPPEELPDLFVEWEEGDTLVERLVHPRAEIRQGRPSFFRDSDHSRQGFFALAGPGVAARGDVGSASLLDLAPTFLSLLGVPKPESWRGRALA